MRFVLTAGGTAGHVNPALAIAQELRELGHELLFAGTPQGIESQLVPLEGFAYQAFSAAGFNRSRPLSILTASTKIAVSAVRARKWLSAVRPDVVVGFGGYVSIPVGLAASWLKIPLAVHEQNSTAGMANKFLAKRAQLVALTYGSAASELRTDGQMLVVGNPVRSALLDEGRQAARDALGLPQDATVLLVFGGSLGALHINEAVVALAEYLMTIPGLQIVQITGKRDYGQVAAQINQMPAAAQRWRLIDYCHNMGQAYAAADAVLSRAGATSLAEISALAKPSLLVPYPHAAADEQTVNAKVLVEAGAAAMVSDAELDEPVFSELLYRLVTDKPYRDGLCRAAKAAGSHNARQRLAGMLVDMGQ
jgi:UDP-N-acetylglucosamine--N-acetylmuramyl-(pentapeptide) pyrophosphoryl-undecaprenol N-acetylglucosamine transferase